MAYEAEPHEVDALLANLCGDILSDPDPLTRYHALTREQALYDALVSTIKRRRGEALAELRADHSEQAVADMAGLGSRQLVGRLVAAARP